MILHGRVASFDATSGLGLVVDDAGAEFTFHATAIADGRREIAVGAAVVFRRVAGHRGRWEADRISTIV